MKSFYLICSVLCSTSPLMAIDHGNGWLQGQGASFSGIGANQASVQVQMGSPELSDVKPGEIVMVTALVTNSDEASASAAIRVSVPNGWQLLTAKEETLLLAPGERRLEIITLKVPSYALVGEYPVTVEVVNPEQPGQNSSARCFLAVAAEKIFHFELAEIPPLAPAGGAYRFLFKAYNRGNQPLSLQLAVSSNRDYDIYCSQNEICIAPGSRYEEEISVATDQLSYRDKYHYVRVEAVDAETGCSLYRGTAATEILPCGSYGGSDEWLAIPSSVRFFMTGESRKKLVPGIAWAGRGYIDEEEKEELEYLFRASTNSHSNLYDEHQRFFVSLTSPDADVTIGDTTYSLTPLTERWRYGRGLGANLYSSPWSYGGFYVQDRLHPSGHHAVKEAAAYVGYDFECDSNFALSYLHKNRGGGNYKGEILSGQIEYHPYEWLMAAVEIARDFEGASHRRHWRNHCRRKHRNWHGGSDRNAFRVELRGRSYSDLWYYLEKYHAGRGFFGYYQGTDITAAGLDMALIPHWRANISTNHYTEVRRRCNHHSRVPNRHQYNAKLLYSFCPNGSWALTYLQLQRRREHREKERCHGITERWVGSNLAYRWSCWSFFCSANVGTLDNHNDSHHHRLQSYYAFASWNATPLLEWRLRFEMGNTNLYRREWRYSNGASCRYNYAPGSFCELLAAFIDEGRCDTLPRSFLHHYLHSMIQLVHIFDNGHTFNGRAEGFTHLHTKRPKWQSNFHDGRKKYEYKFFVSYEIPFSCPLRKRVDVGALEGQLWDCNDDSPVSEAIVNLDGMRTLTDEMGYYRFSGITPGCHALQTELLPRRCMTVERQPINVAISGGGTQRHNIAITTSASIRGTVKQYAFENSLEMAEQLLQSGKTSRAFVDNGTLPYMRIIADRNCGEEIYMTTANALGEFCFVGLRPGRWRILLERNQLPDQMTCDGEIEIELRRGEEREVTFAVVPRERQLVPLE